MDDSHPAPEGGHFIRRIVAADLASGKHARLQTRFPPEPNGYLHVGHAKSICVNFGLAEEFGGLCNLRFDDTNPEAEEQAFVDGILEDIRWLGFDWGERRFFASDYFEQLHGFALQLIERGHAYVCDLTQEETRAYRGTVTEPGRPSPNRDRSPEENLDLFRRMREGEFEAGSRTLRAKIDMASPNMNLRDPVIYRIVRRSHHRTGDAWSVYPMYDFAHGLSDAIEGVTHSLCTLEFENHRALYDWFLERIDVPSTPRQIEFARLNLTYTVLSKRKLRNLVESGVVDGWDDPRMPTLKGMRRRGYTPASIRALCDTVGVTTTNSTSDFVLLENALREELNRSAPRRMAVLDPVRLVIENYPEGSSELVQARNNPEDEDAGRRDVPFSGVLYVERDDFRAEAPRKWFRLAPGKEVRLKYGYYVTCTGFDVDADGELTEIRCTYDPETKGGDSADGRKVRGTIHWVSAEHSVAAPVRLYDHLFGVPNPNDVPEGGDFKDHLNPDSLKVVEAARLEPALGEAEPGAAFQFERHGYFCVDSKDSKPGAPVFNRSVALRDSWAKLEKKLRAEGAAGTA